MASVQAADAASAETNVVQEAIFEAARPYANSFMNDTLDVENVALGVPIESQN